MGARILQTVLITVLIAFQTLFAESTRDPRELSPSAVAVPSR